MPDIGILNFINCMSSTNHFFGNCSGNEHRTQITNFCASMECLKPLCPECIQEHY